MAALQPDVLGLQEVVYPLQQDRLIGAAGEGRYESFRAWAGRPEYGNAMLVRASLAAAADAERLDLGPEPVGAPAGRAARTAHASSSPSPISTTSRPTTAPRDDQARQLIDWLAAAPPTDAQIVVGDFNAEPTEPAAERMRSRRLPVGVRRGERRRARR